MRRSSRSARIAVRLCTWAVLGTLSGCSFLANEFGYFNGRAPAPVAAPAGTAVLP